MEETDQGNSGMRVMRRGFLAVIAIGLFAPALYAVSENDFSLEGVMQNPKSPSQSTAVINGELLKQGDTCLGCTVREIGANYVLLESPPDGTVVKVRLGAVRAPPAAKARAPKASAAKVPAAPLRKEAPSAPAPKDAIAGLPSRIGKVLRMLPEMKALSEMKQIFMAAVQIANRDETDAKGNPVPPNFSLAKMAERGLIPPKLASGRSGNYTYTITSKGHEFEIHGTPIDRNSPARHLMIDSRGVFHGEQGKLATVQSPPLD